MPGNALKLEPWDTAQKDESLPQVPGASTGSWGQSPPPEAAARPTTGLCGLECDEQSPSRNRSPNLRQRMILSNRDKESLLEEIIDLKRALSDQAYHLKLHKVHFSAVQLENRKLEKDVEELEVSGNLEAPRTGGPSRLRAKLQGLRTRLGDLQATCDIQHDELCQLRRDLRVARTRECEVERDVYAAEIGRLQKVVKRLKAMQQRITSENRELGRLKDKAARLKLANQRLESCITITHKTLERANKEVSTYRAKALESTIEAKKCSQKIKELQDQAAILEELLEKERIEKHKIQLKLKALAQKRKEWDREWDTEQKKKAMSAAAEAIRLQKKHAKMHPKVIRKDKGAHATVESSEEDLSSDDDMETDMDLLERKTETLRKLDEKKEDFLEKVKEATQMFVEQGQNHYDKIIPHAGAGATLSHSTLSPKDMEKRKDLEDHLSRQVDAAAAYFMDDVEDIHYESKVPRLNLDDLSPKEAAAAKEAYDKDVAEAAEKEKSHLKALKGGKGGSSKRPGSPSSTFGKSGGSSGFSDSTSHDSDGAQSGTSTGFSSSTSGMNGRKVGFKDGKKMSPNEFKSQKVAFFNKVRAATQGFIQKEQDDYDNILSDVASGARAPGSTGWFSSTSSITSEDKQREQDLVDSFHTEVEIAADSVLDRVAAVQYGEGKVPKLKMKDLRVQEEAERLAWEEEERMAERKELEERARRKAEQDAADRWTSGQNKIEVMVDDAKLSEDEYTADVKQVGGKLSVEINLKRSDSELGSPVASQSGDYVDSGTVSPTESDIAEANRREAQDRLAKLIYQTQQEDKWKRKNMEMARQKKEAEDLERDLHDGLTATEDATRNELEAKGAAGIPLTAEEEAELRELQLKMRNPSGLTGREEARLNELEEKIRNGIPLTAEEEAELKALQAKMLYPSGLTGREETRLKELEEKIRNEIPLTAEEEAELKVLKAKRRSRSGLTIREEARMMELEGKIRNGIPLTAEEEAELKALKANFRGKTGLTAPEEDELRELEEKLRNGIPLTPREEALLRDLRAKIRGKSGLTVTEEARLRQLGEKLQSGIPLTAEEEAEMRLLQSFLMRKSGLTVGEESRLKDLEAKVRSGIPLTAEEEEEMRMLQTKLRINSQLTSTDDARRLALEAKLAAGIPLTEDEQRELRELNAKLWNEWPLSADEDAKRKELEEKLRNGIPLTEEEEALLKELQAKLKKKFPEEDFGEVDMDRKDDIKKRGKLPFIDEEMQGFIKENIRGVLGHLENITEVIVHKQEQLAKHEALMETSGTAMEALKASDSPREDKKTHKQEHHEGGEDHKKHKKVHHEGGEDPGPSTS